MAIQSMTPGNTFDTKDPETDDETSFREAMEKGWLTEDENLYFKRQGFTVPD